MFDEIRAYEKNEFKTVWSRLSQDEEIRSIFARAGFEITPERAAMDNRPEFHGNFMRQVFEALLEKTSQGLTISGFEHAFSTNGRGLTFISNHRDITLDAILLMYALGVNGDFKIKMAVGDNLFLTPQITDFMKLNGCFIVKRGLPGRRQLAAARELSAYIWQELGRGNHVWVAQREGRAKDNNDRTNPAILSMLHMAQRRSMGFEAFIEEANIIPMSVSYEFDPCDAMKARELYLTQRDGRYEKQPGEDLGSMVKGLLGEKGRLHLALAPRLGGGLKDVKAAVEALDRAIIGAHELMPTNLAALELMHGEREPELTEKDRQAFQARLETIPAEHRAILIQMYANPALNKRRLEQTGGR